MRRRFHLVLALAVLSVSTLVRAAPQKPETASVSDISKAIHELRLTEAQAMLEQARKRKPNDPALRFQHARLLFHEGAYAEAATEAERAIDGAGGSEPRWEESLQLFRDTHEATHTHERRASPDGRYVVTHAATDAVLASYALEVLTAADQALSKLFDTQLVGPVRLEIYPTPETLAQVSSLSEEQIRSSGTVALSKWNRLMITSPRALVQGYPWAETVTHELVHMVLSQVTTDNAPVWLQEGIAKSFERAWRGDTAPAPPDAASQALLQEAAASGTLLTFDELHPSIAVLPTQDMAALAFAEVATFIGRFVQEHGMPKLREALAQIRAGVDAKAALATVAGTSFANLEKSWRKGLPRGAPDDAPRVLQRRFASAEAEPDDAESVAEKKASKFLRLGDLLWDRGRFPAATVEYGKAHRAAPLDPIVAARWARAALRRGDADAAVTALEPQAKRYPTHAPTQSLLGAAQLRAGNRAGARAALREALLINPFDPDPHCDLAQATDDEAEARREREACKALQ